MRQFKRTFPNDSQGMRRLIERIKALPGYAFWPADISHELVNLESIHGHQQVTDAYLVALARNHGSKLATFDEALATVYPDVVLIPAEA